MSEEGKPRGWEGGGGGVVWSTRNCWVALHISGLKNCFSLSQMISSFRIVTRFSAFNFVTVCK